MAHGPETIVPGKSLSLWRVGFMQAQTAMVVASEPISFIHETRDGLVHLLVKPSKSGWVALYWGSRVAGAWPSATLAQANENVLRCFQNIYFGHKCSEACRPAGSIAAHKSDDLWGMVRDL
jgi:hypothetical protein